MSTVDLLATSQEPIKPRSYFKQAVAIKPPKRALTPKRFLSCLPYEKGYTALLGIGFFFLFCAFNAAQNAYKSRMGRYRGYTTHLLTQVMQNLQGTIGGEAGSWSLAVLYITNAFSNAFAPIFVKFIREKWCMVIGCSLYIFYLASNINPMPALLMTAAAFCGIGGGLLWNSQSSFVVHISSPGQVGRNSGLFFLFHQASSVVGNIIAATIILLGTLSTQMLFVVFTGISFLGLTTMLFVVTPPLSTQEEIEQAMREKAKMNADKVEHDSEIAKKERRRKIIKRVFTSFILMSNKGALFLIVFWVQNGILQAFAFSTFTSVLGKSWIGWVMAAFGASDAIMSLVFGKIIKKMGCRNMMILSTAALAGVIIVLVTIPLDTLHGFVASLFIIAAVLGLVDAGYTTILFVSISNYFPSKVEAAFGAFRFCQALSVAMMFFIGPHTSYLVQSYIMAGATVCSFASIMVADLRYKSLDKEPIEVEEVKTTIAMPTPILRKSAVPMTPVAAKKTIPDSPATWHPHRREEPIEASESSSLELVSVPFPASTPIVV